MPAELFPAIYKALGLKYPRMAADSRAEIAAAIYKAGTACFDHYGRVKFGDDLAVLAANADQIRQPGPNASSAEKARYARELAERAEDAGRTMAAAQAPAAAPSTGTDVITVSGGNSARDVVHAELAAMKANLDSIRKKAGIR